MSPRILKLALLLRFALTQLSEAVPKPLLIIFALLRQSSVFIPEIKVEHYLKSSKAKVFSFSFFDVVDMIWAKFKTLSGNRKNSRAPRRVIIMKAASPS